MKRLSCLALILTVTLSAMAQNPIIQTHFTTDPAPMVYHDTLFLYVGCDEKDAPARSYLMREYRLYTTTDMVNWTDHGAPLKTSMFKWSAGDASAAQVIERDGKFYWYISSQNQVSPGSSIGVAVGDTPYGPFHDAIGRGLVTNDMTTHAKHSWDDLDPTVYIDDDGQAYLYWGNGVCYYAKLNNDMVSLRGNVEAIDAKDGPALGGQYTEAPWVYKRDGIYYLVYASKFPECISYSTAKTIQGPWQYRGVLMPTEKGSNTNHPGIIDYKGNSYFFYHDDGLPGGHSYCRSVCVEQFDYNPDGTFPIIHMTDRGITKGVGTLNPYQRTEAETIAWSKGITTVEDPTHRIYVSEIHNGDFIEVRDVDFGSVGAKNFTSAVSSRYFGGDIELRIDSMEGEVIGTAKVPYTGEWDSWVEVTTEVSSVKGVHDLYLLFKGRTPHDLFNFDYWKFEEK